MMSETLHLERLERGLDDRDHQLDVLVDRQRAHELDRLLDAVVGALLLDGRGRG